jgi:hypothetical protein
MLKLTEVQRKELAAERRRVTQMPVVLPALDVAAMLKQCEASWLRNHIRRVHARVDGNSYDEWQLILKAYGEAGSDTLGALHRCINAAIARKWPELGFRRGDSGKTVAKAAAEGAKPMTKREMLAANGIATPADLADLRVKLAAMEGAVEATADPEERAILSLRIEGTRATLALASRYIRH